MEPYKITEDAYSLTEEGDVVLSPDAIDRMVFGDGLTDDEQDTAELVIYLAAQRHREFLAAQAVNVVNLDDYRRRRRPCQWQQRAAQEAKALRESGR